MSTPTQKRIAFSITRLMIFVLIVISIYTPPPVGDLLGVASAAAWLYLPTLINLELKIVDAIKRRLNR